MEKILRNSTSGFFVKIGLIILATVLFINNHTSFAGSGSDKEDRNKMLEEIESLQESAHSLEKILELVSEVIKPSVVSVISVKVIKHPSIPFSRGGNQYGNPFGNKKQFRGSKDFFGGRFSDKYFRDSYPDRKFKQQGLGSGIIVNKEGYILTNNHVVNGADEIKVVLGDKREFEAKIIGTDPQSDLAVIKIEGSDLPAAQLGDSDALRVGNWAITIGNPFGFTQTVSVGIISAMGRAHIGIARYENMIQTDAAINPGNSGGPLVNIKGEVIGINTAIYTNTGSYQGIGFAIPINMARVIMKSIIETGRVVRGWLGVVVQDLTPALIKQFEVKVNEGGLVSNVEKNSPASNAGMETGDIIIKYEGKKVKDVNLLMNIVAQTEIGKEVKLIVLRDGKEKSLKIKIQEQPSGLFAVSGSSPAVKDLGLTVQNLTDELARSLGVEESNGVVVTEVVPGSPAANTDIKQSDLIKQVSRKPVNNVEEFRQAIRSARGDNEILFLAKRGDYTRYVILKIK
ncbi:MAG: Do family serine endopeptidase [Candidatus Anammoxibacter sp.]